MQIGYVMSPGRGEVDRILGRFARTLMARGVDVAGLVQTNRDCGPAKACHMDVQVLPSGPVLRISQDLGAASQGCRLNPAALEQAVGLVGQRLTDATRLLIVNKFGKQEAEGRGFREVIGEALGRGIPVVVGLNGLNQARFEDFCGGMAEPLSPDVQALLAWFETATDPV